MEKKYQLPEESHEDNNLHEPTAEYIYKDKLHEGLLNDIEEAEKDIAEGNIISLEDAIKKILG